MALAMPLKNVDSKAPQRQWVWDLLKALTYSDPTMAFQMVHLSSLADACKRYLIIQLLASQILLNLAMYLPSNFVCLPLLPSVASNRVASHTQTQMSHPKLGSVWHSLACGRHQLTRVADCFESGIWSGPLKFATIYIYNIYILYISDHIWLIHPSPGKIDCVPTCTLYCIIYI